MMMFARTRVVRTEVDHLSNDIMVVLEVVSEFYLTYIVVCSYRSFSKMEDSDRGLLQHFVVTMGY